MTSAIYQIVDNTKQRIYIGSSSNFEKRKGQHLSDLKHDRHVNIYLQRIYDKHGLDNLVFSVLEEVDSSILHAKEQEWIDKLLPCINIGSVGGGDNMFNNPNKEDVMKRISESLVKKYATISSEDRKRIYGHPAETNPNFNNWASLFYCLCGNPIAKTANSCTSCQDRTGTSNPFYGKQHTEETKYKLKQANKGKKPINTMEIVIDNITYKSASDAAKAIGCALGTVLNRCRSDKFLNYSIHPHPLIKGKVSV
jgi:group I intron endonuclease